jgi:phosphorylcholine metabolism protein LicD
MADIKEYATNKHYVKFLYKSFYDLHNILIDFNISYWADGGTLLGAIRHKGIIDVDDDVDVCVSYKDVPLILSNEFKKALKKKGYYVKLHSESGERAINGEKYDWIKINSKKKVNGMISSIDIFTQKIERDDDNKLRTYFESEYAGDIWPKMYHYLDDLLPLKQVKFGKGVIVIPNKPKKYLDRSYGKSWKNVMYVTMDKDHMMLPEPIKIKKDKFTPAKDLADASSQILLPKNDILLTMKGNNLL